MDLDNLDELMDEPVVPRRLLNGVDIWAMPRYDAVAARKALTQRQHDTNKRRTNFQIQCEVCGKQVYVLAQHVDDQRTCGSRACNEILKWAKYRKTQNADPSIPQRGYKTEKKEKVAKWLTSTSSSH